MAMMSNEPPSLSARAYHLWHEIQDAIDVLKLRGLSETAAILIALAARKEKAEP